MLGLEGFLSNLDQLGECIGIGDRHVGEDLAVEGDPGLLEPVHELGVGQAADAAAALMRVIQRRRISRFLLRRSR